MSIWLIYSTFPHKQEAVFVARALLEKRLVACANIYENVTSIYRWEGSIHEASEVTLMAKTGQETLSAAIKAIKAMHSYQLPCIVAYPIEEGFPPFLQWVAEETAD